MKKVFALEEHCVGCKLCEVYCITAHSESKNVVKAYKYEDKKPVSRIIIEENKPVSFAMQCRQCEDTPCVKGCITGAMQINEDGAVVCDEERCVGCWTCILTCPYGAVMRDEQGKKVASKCDLCAEAGTPACVEHCPNGALIYCEGGDRE